MKILGPRLINNDKYLLYVEDTAMDPSQLIRKRKLSSPPSTSTGNDANSGDGDTDRKVETASPSPRKTGKRRRKQKVVERLLGEDYQPEPHDVICARGKEAASHPGNIQFRSMIDNYLDTYRSTETKKEKTAIVCNIIDSVRSASPKGKFVRKQTDGGWYETGDDFAREKIGQCFRDRLHTDYRSSSKAKISRRKETTGQSTTVRNAMPMDFDEYVASPDPSSQNPLHLITPSVAVQQSAGHSPGWLGGHARSNMPPPSGGDFAGYTRRKTTFQGLADMYFGDSSQPVSQQFSAPARPDCHNQWELLGSFNQNPRDSSRNFQNAMLSRSNMMMDQSFRGHDVGYRQQFESGSGFSNGNQEMSYSYNNTNSFSSLPTNAFMNERLPAFGVPVGENFPLRDAAMDQSQRLPRPTMELSMGHQRVGSMGIDMVAMGAAKDLGYMQHDASWHSRTERKPPPMPPSMFETPSFSELGAQQDRIVPQRQQQHAPPSENAKASLEGIDSSGESSRIPDDEPLPLD